VTSYRRRTKQVTSIDRKLVDSKRRCSSFGRNLLQSLNLTTSVT